MIANKRRLAKNTIKFNIANKYLASMGINDRDKLIAHIVLNNLMTTKEIARVLGLTVRTVNNIRRKERKSEPDN